MRTAAKIEFGDFQTPLPLAREVCALLLAKGIVADWILEPTCGVGSFLEAASEAFPLAQLTGYDINPQHLEVARLRLGPLVPPSRLALETGDFFAVDWKQVFSGCGQNVLVLGNPPWVTNASVSSLNGANVPLKENFLNLRGLAARTGKSNFDISEWMLIHLLQVMRTKGGVIAVLCKTATARKVLRYGWQTNGHIAEASIHLISAMEHFGAAVDACLLVLSMGANGPARASIYSGLQLEHPATRMGLAGKDLVADVDAYLRLRHFEGLCPYHWRSGLKHDCAPVMELRRLEDGTFTNKSGEIVAMERDYVFPLLKCSDLANGRATPGRFVLVTQRTMGESTEAIAGQAPQIWSYLNSHKAAFAARKSSIYRGRDDFALFGIGEYAFAPWKVAISGLHKQPRFMLVPPFESRPVLFDDTCYYLSFTNEEEARSVERILNSPSCRAFLGALIFNDAKRPVTVELLQRLDIGAIAATEGLLSAWQASRGETATTVPRANQMELAMESAAPFRMATE